MCLNKASRLKYLNLKNCSAFEECFEEILASCNSLQKLSMASTFLCMSISQNMIESICYQNGRTLQTLNLSGCCYLDLVSVKKITNYCKNLKNVDFGCTHMSEDSIKLLVNNLTSTVEKLNLGFFFCITDDHVKTLVERCDKLSVLILRCTSITNISLAHIIENLPDTLEKIDVSWCSYLTYAKLNEVKSMPNLKVLNCRDLNRELLEKNMHMFDEEISADERKFLSNEGIWDIKAEQILYSVVELRKN